MEAFAAGGADVLVATTVIEVGIDVPNATVMLVEDAERYGISQLHQLRGRVGRGEHPSLCLLFGPADSPRLKALARHTRRLRAGRDRPRAARRGRADRHAPVGPRALSLRAPARGRGDPRARPRPRGGAAARGPRPAGARAVRCWPRSSRRPRRSPWRREGRGRAPRRPAAARAARAATRGRPPIACARRCSRCSGRSTARACSTCSPGRARWASRRSRGGRRRPRWSSATGARSRSSAPISRRSGSARTRPAWSMRRRARRSATHRRAATHTIWSSSTRRTGTRRRWDGSSRRPCPPCWRPRRGS